MIVGQPTSIEDDAISSAINLLHSEFGDPENPDPLDPELEAVLSEGRMGMRIDHPLVMSVMHIPQLNRRCNLALVQKKEALQEAIRENKWFSYVYLHERPWRCPALLEVLKGDLFTMTDQERLDLISDVWTDSENIHQYVMFWHEVWDRNNDQFPIIRDGSGIPFAELEDVLTVYRGNRVTESEHEQDGWFSWTLDRQKAHWFAVRFNPVGIIVTATVKKADVLAYYTERGESEIVCLPESVVVQKIDHVSKV